MVSHPHPYAGVCGEGLNLDPMTGAPLPGEASHHVPANAFNPFNPFDQIISGGSRARRYQFGTGCSITRAMLG